MHLAPAKIEQAARVVPMEVDPAQSATYIVNPLTGRQVRFRQPVHVPPPTCERIRRLVSGEWLSWSTESRGRAESRGVVYDDHHCNLYLGQ